DQAETLYEEALAIVRTTGDRDNAVTNLGNLAFVAIARGAPERARPFLAEAVRTVDARNARTIGVLEALAAWLCERKEWLPAARYFGSVHAERARIRLERREPVDEAFLSPRIVRIREALGDMVFEAAWGEGQAMGMEVALTEARRLLE